MVQKWYENVTLYRSKKNDNWENPFHTIEKDLKKNFQFNQNIEFHILLEDIYLLFLVEACIIEFFKVKRY